MTCKDCVHYEVCKRIDYELEYHNKSIKEAEEELPIKCRFFKYKANVAPVVRCKDCKYSTERQGVEKRMWNDNCVMCDHIAPSDRIPMNKNDYCSYGESENNNAK